MRNGMKPYRAGLAVRWAGELRVDPAELAAAVRDGWARDGLVGWEATLDAPGQVSFAPRPNLVTTSGVELTLDRTFGLTNVTAQTVVVSAIGVDNGTANPVAGTNMSATLNVTNCTLTSGSANVTTTDTADLAGVAVGMGVTGTDVPSGTTVTAVDPSAGTLTLSANASASTVTTLTFATSTSRTILTMSPAASRTGEQVTAGVTFTNSNVNFVMKRLFLNTSTTDAAGNLYACTNVFTIDLTSFSSWSQSFTPTITASGS